MLKQIMVMSLTAGMAAGLFGYVHAASGVAEIGAQPALAEMPDGYRDWPLIAVAHEEGKLDDLRAILGNDIAIKAFREGAVTYPDGTILARLAWDYHPLEESKEAFGTPQSFVSGVPKNGVQFMIKDSQKFASTGGWGYVEFDDGKPSTTAMPQACFSCHSIVKGRDFVFNRYAP